MHSLHAVKKREQDLLVMERLRSRTDPRNPTYHRMKTRKLAQNYEARVDDWLVQTSESKIEPVPKVRLACHHNFRERSVDMELANPRVSPLNYTKERDRVDAEVTQGSSSLVMREPWTQKSGSLFREREPGKEVQPIMVFSHRSAEERIIDQIAKNPVMPLQPWTRFDNPIYRKFRDPDPLKFAGGDNDFDLYRSRGFGARSPPSKDFLMSKMPFARPFGSRADDFRPHDPSLDLQGRFFTITPGYLPDWSPGKWRMDREISGPPESPTLWHEHYPPARTSPSSDLRVEPPGVLTGTRNRSKTSMGSRSLEDKSGPLSKAIPKGPVQYPLPKTYWKATTQVSAASPTAAHFYEEEVNHQNSFSDHTDRAEVAKRLTRQHMGVQQALPTIASPATSPLASIRPAQSLLSSPRD